MQARVEILEDVTIIHLSGRIDYESADRFKESCRQSFREQKLVFNLDKLSFVGSSGITPFLEAITELREENKSQIKLSQVSSEFKRILESGELKNIEIFETYQDAKSSYREVDYSMVDTDFIDS